MRYGFEEMTLSNEIWLLRDDVKQWDNTFKRWRQGMTEGMMEKVARNDVRNVWRDDQKIEGMTVRNDHFFSKNDCKESSNHSNHCEFQLKLRESQWGDQAFCNAVLLPPLSFSVFFLRVFTRACWFNREKHVGDLLTEPRITIGTRGNKVNNDFKLHQIYCLRLNWQPLLTVAIPDVGAAERSNSLEVVVDGRVRNFAILWLPQLNRHNFE